MKSLIFISLHNSFQQWVSLVECLSGEIRNEGCVKKFSCFFFLFVVFGDDPNIEDFGFFFTALAALLLLLHPHPPRRHGLMSITEKRNIFFIKHSRTQ